MSLSFEESKKKLIAQAMMPETLSMTRAVAVTDSVQPAAMTMDEPVMAAYEQWTRHTSYKWFDNFYDESRSTIEDDKNIAANKSQLNISQEINAQYIPFEMKRYWDNVDLVDMAISIHYVSSDGYHGADQAINVEFSDTKIRFGWRVDEGVTHISGGLKVEIHADGAIYDNEGTAYAYRWKTKSNASFYVYKSA